MIRRFFLYHKVKSCETKKSTHLKLNYKEVKKIYREKSWQYKYKLCFLFSLTTAKSKGRIVILIVCLYLYYLVPM